MRRLIEGLRIGIQFGMARETNIGTTIAQVVEIARRMEGIRRHEREECEAKKPCSTGRFSGALSRGKGHYVKGYLGRLVQSAL